MPPKKNTLRSHFRPRCHAEALVRFPDPISEWTDTEDATRVLTGPASWSAWALSKSAADAVVLTGGGGGVGGGLGGCRWTRAKAGAAGDVRLTYSDRSTSSWRTQEPTNQTRAQRRRQRGRTLQRRYRRDTYDDDCRLERVERHTPREDGETHTSPAVPTHTATVSS